MPLGATLLDPRLQASGPLAKHFLALVSYGWLLRDLPVRPPSIVVSPA